MDCRIDAMIGGVEKGGTTSLGRYLAEHPDILSHLGPDMGIEDHEFTPFVTGAARDPDRFRETFVKAFGRSPEHGEFVLGKSVGILHLPDAARELHRHNPDCRLILSLRDPVDRAYSSYWHQRKRGEEPAETFEEALELELVRERNGVWSPDRMYLGKGRYVEHLRRLHGLFGREQVHVLLLEDLKGRPDRTVNEVFKHLGLQGHPVEEKIAENRAKLPRWPWLAQLIQQESTAKDLFGTLVPEGVRTRLWWWIRRINAVEAKPPPMSDETRRRLKEHFRPYNRRLEDLLGRDLSRWDR